MRLFASSAGGGRRPTAAIFHQITFSLSARDHHPRFPLPTSSRYARFFHVLRSAAELMWPFAVKSIGIRAGASAREGDRRILCNFLLTILPFFFSPVHHSVRRRPFHRAHFPYIPLLIALLNLRCVTRRSERVERALLRIVWPFRHSFFFFLFLHRLFFFFLRSSFFLSFRFFPSFFNAPYADVLCRVLGINVPAWPLQSCSLFSFPRQRIP